MRGVIIKERPKLRGVLVPFWFEHQVVSFVVVPDVKPLVSPQTGDHLCPKHKLPNLSLNSSQLLRLVQGKDVVEDGVHWDGLEVLGERPHVLIREVNLPRWLES